MTPTPPRPSTPPTSPPGTPPLPGERLTRFLDHTAGWLAARPGLAAVPLLLAAGVVVARRVRLRRRQTRLARHARYLTITPPAVVEPAGAAGWWANLYELLAPHRLRRLLAGVPHVAVEYRWAGRQLTIGVWLPGTVPAGPVLAAARAAWPGAAAAITQPTPPLPDGVAVGGLLGPALPGWYPINIDHEVDPMRPLLAAAAGLHPAEHACVQILARPATPRQTRRLRAGAAALRTGHPAGGPLDPTTWLRGLLDLATPGPTRPTSTRPR